MGSEGVVEHVVKEQCEDRSQQKDKVQHEDVVVPREAVEVIRLSRTEAKATYS